MQLVKFLILISFIFWGAKNTVYAEEKIPEVLLKYNVQTIGIDGNNFLSINFSNYPHWHTYWKNPGDAGFGPKIKFLDHNNKEINLEALEWPSPNRFIEPGDIWAYGYENEYSFFYRLPSNFNISLTADLNWLICKHICIPGKSSAQIEIERSFVTKFQINENKLLLDHLNVKDIENRFKLLPIEDKNSTPEIDIVLAIEKEENNLLALFYNLSSKSNDKYFLKNRNLIFPYPHPYLEFKHEELYEDQSGTIYAKMLVEWNGLYEEPEIPFPKDGILTKNLELSFDFFSSQQNKVIKINKNFSRLYGGEKLNSFLKILKPFVIEQNFNNENPNQISPFESKAAKEIDFITFIKYILFALLGGFILNFMPCVLPVISLKLFGLINQKNQSHKKILQHNLFYTLGVISTFVVISIFVIILQKSGQAIGWGFQMQSPTFLATISIFLFVFALNLFGLFEFITPGGNKLGSIKIEGSKGDFINGVLATILSTPCSAPFLGTALSFAFTSGPITILTIFVSVGVGLSLPFIATGLFPSAINFLPRPGNWMNHFKKFLGLSLLATIFWLISIFNQINTDEFSLYILITLFVISPVCITIYQKIKKNIFILITGFLITLVGIFTISKNQNNNLPIAKREFNENQDKINKYKMTWKVWNPEIINEQQGIKKPTFVDFTADWCLTCKVNEKLIINTDDFRNFISSNNIDLIMGDWTDGDPEMTKWLQKNGMAGVPAYFFIDKSGNLHNLGETISIKKLKELL